MGLFNLFSKGKINDEVKRAEAQSGSFIIDVRTHEEYEMGHIPNSVNIALHELDDAQNIVKDKAAPVYVYCQSGARSAQAAKILKQFGYEDVTDMGGIMAYSGNIERG